MKKLILFFMIAIVSLNATASGDEALLPVTINVRDTASLQRGAKLFMNYCSGCHSLRYLRYNRMANDLGLTTFDGAVDTDLLENNLIFTSAKIHDPIQISMPEEDALQWFGRVPPDLSLSARERGASWLYTYLKSFYADPKRPFGANNILIPDVSMPNVLQPLSGIVIAQNLSADHNLPVHLVHVERGEMTQQQFDSAVQDLVTFLVYAAEPVKLVRYKIGIFVILFLIVFTIVAYRLKKNYWRDVH